MHPGPKFSTDDFEIFATDVDHPECIAFDRAGDLWAGGEIGQIYRIPPDGKARLVTTMGGFCAGLAFSPADELFVCNPQHGIVRIQPDGGLRFSQRTPAITSSSARTTDSSIRRAIITSPIPGNFESATAA